MPHFNESSDFPEKAKNISVNFFRRFKGFSIFAENRTNL